MTMNCKRLVLGLAFAMLAMVRVGDAEALTTGTSATSAILVELGTGAVLLEKDSHIRIPPASMSKLMTLEVVFRALTENRLTLDDTFPVNEGAWKKGGSKMYVEVGDDIRVEDLIRGIIVSSGNDACIVIAEGFDGSEELFAKRLNHRGRELGLTGSNFTNASGWPDPGHYMTAKDLTTLATHIIKTYPQYLPLFAETEFTWEGITQQNRNPLLFMNIGSDGLKTGYTEEAGFSLVGTAVRDDRRLLLVVAGLETSRVRAMESRRLIEWGFREFASRTFFKAGEPIAEADVWMGDKAKVNLVVSEDMRGLAPVSELGRAAVTLRTTEPVAAPIEAGQQLGTVEVAFPDGLRFTKPVVAAEPVEQGGILVKTLTLMERTFFGDGSE